MNPKFSISNQNIVRERIQKTFSLVAAQLNTGNSLECIISLAQESNMTLFHLRVQNAAIETLVCSTDTINNPITRPR